MVIINLLRSDALRIFNVPLPVALCLPLLCSFHFFLAGLDEYVTCCFVSRVTHRRLTIVPWNSAKTLPTSIGMCPLFGKKQEITKTHCFRCKRLHVACEEKNRAQTNWQTMANPTWFHHVPSINTQKCYGNTCTHILNHPEQFVSAHHITSKKTIQWTWTWNLKNMNE